jgi:hypothetical protein
MSLYACYICVHIIVLENAKFLIFFFKLKKKGLNFEKGPSFFLRLNKKVAKKDPPHPTSCRIFF